jgi:hypothetical protein
MNVISASSEAVQRGKHSECVERSLHECAGLQAEHLGLIEPAAEDELAVLPPRQLADETADLLGRKAFK